VLGTTTWKRRSAIIAGSLQSGAWGIELVPSKVVEGRIERSASFLAAAKNAGPSSDIGTALMHVSFCCTYITCSSAKNHSLRHGLTELRAGLFQRRKNRTMNCATKAKKAGWEWSTGFKEPAA